MRLTLTSTKSERVPGMHRQELIDRALVAAEEADLSEFVGWAEALRRLAQATHMEMVHEQDLKSERKLRARGYSFTSH